MNNNTNSTQLAVIGGGPGGYAAAFMGADLGMEVTLIDLDVNPGGVCLYRGCIPSKALLHVTKLLHETRAAANWGLEYAEPKIDLDKLRAWKNKVVDQMTSGLGQLSKQRKVNYIQGRGRLRDATTIEIERVDGNKEVLTAQNIILATGSRPATIPNQPSDSARIMDSTAALELEDIPEKLLVVGGGYIGLELGSVYAALGSKVTIVEMLPQIASGADRDLLRPLTKRLEAEMEAIMLNTRLTEMREEEDGVLVRFEGEEVKEPEQRFDKILVAVGRVPNSEELGLENTKVEADEHGYVKVNNQLRTAEPTIYAIGDLNINGPNLAHKATHEGRTAAEAIAGHKVAFEPHAIPAVIYTDPEIAYAGLTETEAKDQKRQVEVVRFPWAASGRATTLDRNEGVTKLIIDSETERVLGVGIVGAGAGELIAEGVLAIEMAALATDVRLSIHPHPTLSETMMEAADVFFGQSTHIYRPKRERRKK
jgi:dihydrolipoamide dehydrogenase